MTTQLHDLLHRAVEPLEQMPDAVPDVLVRGRHSVRLRRSLTAAGTVVTAAAGVAAVVGVTALSAGPAEEPPAASPAASASASPRPTATATTAEIPVTREPTGEPGEEARHPGLTAFHRALAPKLDAALPARFGTVTAGQQLHSFVIGTGSKKLYATLRVDDWRKKQPLEPLQSCQQLHAETSKWNPPYKRPCADRTLPDGAFAVATKVDTFVSSRETRLTPSVNTVYNGKQVWLTLIPASVPVDGPKDMVDISNEEMLDVFADPTFSAALREWAANPKWTNWYG